MGESSVLVVVEGAKLDWSSCVSLVKGLSLLSSEGSGGGEAECGW